MRCRAPAHTEPFIVAFMETGCERVLKKKKFTKISSVAVHKRGKKSAADVKLKSSKKFTGKEKKRKENEFVGNKQRGFFTAMISVMYIKCIWRSVKCEMEPADLVGKKIKNVGE